MNSSNALHLPATLTINQCQEFLTDLNEVQVGDSAIGVLDGSQVKQITTPAMQLIVAFFQTLTLIDGSLKIINPSIEMRDAFYQIGLIDQFTKWSSVDV